MEVKCQLCGNGFEAKRCDAKYCPTCQLVKHKEYEAKTEAKRRRPNKCIDCGQPCSRNRKRCKSCAHKDNHNHSWKGGRYQQKSGYIYIHSPNYPGKRHFHDSYVAEHKLVWEKEHGQLLPDGWLIHHINGIRDDNRPENLLAVQPNGHSKQTLIKILQERIRELEKK